MYRHFIYNSYDGHVGVSLGSALRVCLFTCATHTWVVSVCICVQWKLTVTDKTCTTLSRYTTDAFVCVRVTVLCVCVSEKDVAMDLTNLVTVVFFHNDLTF